MNVLVDVIPPRYRRYVYALVTLAAIVWGAWEASQGDWQVFTGALIAALVTATAAANTDTPPKGHDDSLRA